MKSNSPALLHALLLSTSQWNTYKHCKDKKKKGRIVGGTVGMSVLFIMLMAYCILMCIGFGMIGAESAIPGINALTISLLAFFFTFFKTNGYLFNFKEYDMLMALPLKAKTVAGCKFLYMYVKTLSWYLSITLAMMIGYGIYAKPAFFVYPLWVVLSLVLPIIPMLFASFLGFLITRISAGFRKTNIVQVILTFALIVFVMFIRFMFEDMFRNDKVEETLVNMNETIDQACSIYFPANWFSKAVGSLNILDAFLLTVVSFVLFELLFILVGRSYREINSKLKSHAASKKANLSGRKKKSVLNSIAFKEFKRMTGSTVYITNAAVGEIFAVLFGIAVLFFDIDKALTEMFQGAPITKEMLIPAVPLIMYFFIGMVATTAISPSAEGKNYWIVKSLPLTDKTLYQGKMLFNMYLTVPFMLFGTLCVCISARVSLLTSILSLLCGFALCAFSTTWGCVCGRKHMRLDWENEVEIVKQGAAVSLYLLPNMFGTMMLIPLTVFLGMRVNQNLIMAAMILVYSLLSFISYKKAVA
ncbi:MAG: hypothetical protein K6E19_10650 [Lachnospiraceae bacterium]|nr:hypothetical protein [Lachnospiraceae bacterium]